MDVVLFTITLVSLASAIIFGTLAWQAYRQEHRRADARVAALSAAIDGDSTTRGAGMPVAAHPQGMFAPERHVAARGHVLIKGAVGIAMTLAVIVAVAMGTREAGSPVHMAAPALLELLSMRHTRDGGNLTVSGFVRNPAAGPDIDHVTVVVLAFDQDGGFVASGRAPLEIPTLRPGDESPFMVTIAGVGIERYRVTFRTDGGVVRHLDRRAAATRPAATSHL